MDGVRRLHQDYAAAFLGFLTGRDENGLRAAYELGRRAVADPVGLLNLVHVHHQVLMRVLHTARTPEERSDIGHAAAAFLVEALTSFQMTQRGFLENVRTSAGPTTTPDGGSGRIPGSSAEVGRREPESRT
jgi:Phosphoserine phosphatase RsbU, N-terminal domain